MRRRSFNTKERARLFGLYGGVCYLCDGKIFPGETWEVEHVIPWALTQDDSDDNLRLAHSRCHKPKTRDDVRGIRKADRQRNKHIGAKSKSRSSFSRPKDVEFNWSTGRYERRPA